jgi:hypothetical protein
MHPNSEDAEKASRLIIELSHHPTWEWRQTRWADGKKQRVEDCLPALLSELETRAVEDRQRKTAEGNAKIERRANWEKAMEVARKRATEDHYEKVLDQQVARWRRAKELRRYRHELEQRLTASDTPDGDSNSIRDWLDWIDRHINQTDPHETLPSFPDLPILTHEQLKPYLGGWSPHGPESNKPPRHW